MNVNLLVMDESSSADTDVASLTGILIPVEKAGHIRDAMCKFLRELQSVPPNEIRALPELHGRAMFRNMDWATDEHRLRAFEHVVAMVNASRLEVIRVAYSNHRQLRDALRPDDRLHRLCFFGIVMWLQKYLANGYVLPIMDGLEEAYATRFNGLVTGATQVRGAGLSANAETNCIDRLGMISTAA